VSPGAVRLRGRRSRGLCRVRESSRRTGAAQGRRMFENDAYRQY
jgi:hypothetical protein